MSDLQSLTGGGGNSLLLRRRMMMQGMKRGRLPDEYQEVEYIRNNDVQDGVSISFNAQPGDYIAIYIKALVRGNGLNYMIGGPGPVTRNNAHVVRSYYQNGTDATNISGVSASGGISCPMNTIFESELSTRGKTTDGIFTPLERRLNHTLYSLELFYSQPPGSSANHYTNGDIFSARVTINSSTKELVPCYRKSDGKCGFYDLGESQFRGCWNNKLTAGPDV